MEYLLLALSSITLTSIFLIFHFKDKLKVISEENEKLTQTTFSLDRKKIELESVLQVIDDGVIITDVADNISMVSQKALKILKTDLPGLQNKPIGNVITINPPDKKILSKVETTLTLQSGETVTAKVSSLPILTEGEVRGIIYSIHDATREKEFEEIKLDFVTMAAHQLRTPLTTLRSYLSVLSGSIVNKLENDEKKLLDRSVSGANQLSSLIENLINITHIENRLTLQIKQVKLEDLVRDVAAGLSVTEKEKEIKIKIHKPTELPSVSVDPFLITQVLNNLIVNALEHSSKGSSIDISIKSFPNEITVDVKDYGEGIPYEATNHLFEKFYQVPNNLATGSKGQGLGLYISKKIIEVHKGKIWVNSIQGRGATFSFSLPVNKPST